MTEKEKVEARMKAVKEVVHVLLEVEESERDEVLRLAKQMVGAAPAEPVKPRPHPNGMTGHIAR